MICIPVKLPKRLASIPAFVDKEDESLTRQFKWFLGSGGHAYTFLGSGVSKKNVYMHHLIFGKPPVGFVIDHKNINPLDNRKGNLRVCTKAENNRNSKMSPKNKSGFKGVSLGSGVNKLRTKPWRGDIKMDGKRIFLGWFPTPQEAHKAYEEAALKYHGEFARTN